MNNSSCAKKVSEKLSKIISNSLSLSEIKIFNLAEKADALSFDALYLWVLKNHFGFTKEQLISLYNKVSSTAEGFKEYSLSGCYIPPVDELKEYGIDLEKLSKEGF